ncbi:MAG: ABC transporter permease [Xanthobacteraceae bacterium]|jgi:cell division transport system permease protein
MSMTEPVETMTEPWDAFDAAPSLVRTLPAAAPIVPKNSIAGRSLTVVVAIMTFLASLTTGVAMLVVSAASDWQSEVGREVTIQVRPAPGRNLDADVRTATEIARAAPGIAEVRAFTKEESARLVEPWLGAGLALDDLPIPRLIVVKLASGVRPDFTSLRQALATRVPTSTLDDHRRWIDRMRTMAGTAVIGCIAVLGLVLAVTVLSVTFATRGTMATNRPIVEVLHYVGATDSFVAGQFQRHFLLLGFRGGALGGGAAILMFGVVEAANSWLAGTAGGDQIAGLFGNLSIGVAGYLAIVLQIIFMALVTAFASRRTVNRTLETID